MPRRRTHRSPRGNLVRLSVGIEAVEDLVADLADALVPVAAAQRVTHDPRAVVFVEIPSGSRSKYEYSSILFGGTIRFNGLANI